MSLPYDEEIFKRGQLGGFILSQRVKHICYRFRDTFKTACQFIFANVMLRELPRSMVYGLIYAFICYVFVLCLLITCVSTAKKKRKYKYTDMISASYSRKMIVECMGNGGFFYIISYISIVSIVLVVLLEKMTSNNGLFYCFCTFFNLLVSVIYSLVRPSMKK